MKKIKRGAIESIPCKFLFSISLSIAIIAAITIATTITTAATLSPEEQTDVSIPVDNDFPIIEIHSPQNTTYNNATQILINFTITDLTLNTIWYSLNHEQNITISRPFYLNFSEKNYTLTLYANDSLNRISSEEISFTINNSVIPCGDAICSSQESCSSCQQDCGSCPQPPGNGGSSGGGGGGGGGEITQQPSQDEDIEIPEQERNQTPLGGETTPQDETQTNGKRSSQTPSIFSTIIFIIITLIIISSIIILIIFYKKRKNKKTSKSKKRDLSKKNKSSNIQPVQPAFYH